MYKPSSTVAIVATPAFLNLECSSGVKDLPPITFSRSKNLSAGQEPTIALTSLGAVQSA